MQAEQATSTQVKPRDWGEWRSRPVTWYDPAILRAAAAELSGRELMEALYDGKLPPPPVAGLVDARLASVGDGEASFLYSPHESGDNGLGTVSGGLICMLLDFAACAAVQTCLPAAVGFSSIEIKVSFLRPVRAGAEEIEVHGEALRVGRQVAFAEACARTASGELVGQATTSIAVRR